MHVWQLWVDLETTGLDPGTGRILEIGAVAVNPQGEFVRAFDQVVHVPDAAARAMCPEAVWHMHTRSGLLAEAAKSTVDEGQAAVWFHQWVDTVIPHSEQIVLGGSGLGFDVRWMRDRGWALPDRAVYWQLDVGVLRRAFHQSGVPWDTGASSGEEKQHRALGDAYAHWDEWLRATQMLREHLGSE